MFELHCILWVTLIYLIYPLFPSHLITFHFHISTTHVLKNIIKSLNMVPFSFLRIVWALIFIFLMIPFCNIGKLFSQYGSFYCPIFILSYSFSPCFHNNNCDLFELHGSNDKKVKIWINLHQQAAP